MKNNTSHGNRSDTQGRFACSGRLIYQDIFGRIPTANDFRFVGALSRARAYAQHKQNGDFC